MTTPALHHSHNRTKEWHTCCHDILMGRDPKRHRLDTTQYIDQEEADDDTSQQPLEAYAAPGHLAINLCHKTKPPPNTNEDGWMSAASAMSSSIDEVSLAIRRSSEAFSSDTLHTCFRNPHRNDASSSVADKSIIETTAASFAASMAKQIDSLRRAVATEEEGGGDPSNDDAIHQHHSSDSTGHRAGIASVLMTRLKLEVMEPMTERMSVRRGGGNSGEARRIAEAPLESFTNDGRSVMVLPPPPAPWEIGEHDDERERSEREEERMEFINVYYDDEGDVGLVESMEKMERNRMPPSSVIDMIDLPKPKSTIEQRQLIQTTNQPTTTSKQHQQSSVFHNFFTSKQTQSIPNEYTTQTDPQETEQQQQLQRESATLLQTYQHSDLSTVQNVERSMVEITQLLSRFTDLITEQQEDIFMIHDGALKSKENVDRGQEELVDAARRGEKSRHPMAGFIVCMGLLLLFFNWILP